MTDDVDSRKAYLGDGAYVQIGNYHGEVVLTNEDGICEQDRITLGPHEMSELLRWLEERKQ